MSERNRCPKCGRELDPSDVGGYKFVCHHCDENFYGFEAVKEPSKTGFRCPKCGQTESFTASAVVVIGETHIGPDGWDYWSSGGHVELYERAFLHCEECGFSAHHGVFEV